MPNVHHKHSISGSSAKKNEISLHANVTITYHLSQNKNNKNPPTNPFCNTFYFYFSVIKEHEHYKIKTTSRLNIKNEMKK